MVTCLLGARYSMEAELLTWSGILEGDENTVGTGTFETYQDPITFEILNRWIPGIGDDPDTVDDETDITPITFKCQARGIVDGGIRVAGTTERFQRNYENIDFIHMWTPTNVMLNKRDRVTNIRYKKGGTVVWKNEEGDGAPTIFNVNGVTPMFDAFNNHVGNFALLERA